MKIIWADHDPSWGSSNPSWDAPGQEELKAEVELAQKFSRKGTEETAQEKSSRRELKGFG